MTRKLSPQALTAAFLTLSAALSIAILSARNLFDDELFSLYLVTGHIRDILAITAQGDVHPPGMYVLAHLAWRILPSYRWMNLAPIFILYAGLAVFLLQVAPLFTRTRSQLCFLLLATLHPQLLLWGNTFRWYSWWTGLALITLAVALQPSKPHPTFTTARALTLGLLLAALFYLNYITFLFAVALGVAISLRYRSQPPKALFTRALLAAVVFLALIAPQFHTMFAVHIPNSHAQHASVVVSTLRLIQSISTSEAYLPWHPLALLAALLFVGLCVLGLIRLPALLRARLQPCRKTPPAQGASAPEVTPPPPLEGPLISITLFALFFFFLVAATGLGGRPRNALLLIPTLAPLATLIFETLRPRLQTALLLFFTLWSAVGAAHLLGRYGLTKSSLNDHPEQVAAFVAQNTTCNVVVTYDSLLAFTLAQANLPRTLIISPYRGPGFDGALTLPPAGCPQTRLYAVRSYLNGSARRVQTYNGELEIAQQYIETPPATHTFNPDPDAPRKRRLAALGLDAISADPLPDYRYVVTSGPIDSNSIEAMRSRMPHFVSGYDADPNHNVPPAEER